MDGALVYSPLRNADPLFREEKAFLTASSVVCGVELKWLDFLEAESYLETCFKKIDFLYFYDEDLYLEDLAVRLGIPTFNTPDNYLPAHDLGAFYKRMKENDLPCPAFYASPNLGKYPLSRNFESLSVSLKDAGVFYPFCLRRKEEVAVYKPSLCLTPIEFNGELMELGSTPFVAEEHLKGPSLLALAIGERCYGVLEKKDGAYVRSCYDDRFVRHMVVSALRASQRQADYSFSKAMAGRLCFPACPPASIWLCSNASIRAIRERLSSLIYARRPRRRFPITMSPRRK